MTATSGVLELSGLTTEIRVAGGGTIRPVVDATLTIRRGETLCLVGESGSGKSMLALSVMRVLPPNAAIVSGSVTLAGDNLTALSDEEMRQVRGNRVAMIPQDPMTAFDPLLPVGSQIVETIRAHRKLGKRAARQLVLEALDAVRLPSPERVARALPSQLSGGMNQRCLIATALVTEPEVLLADEPTTALDVTVQAQVLELLREIQRERGLAIVLITHDMGVAAMVADRVAVMYAGRVVEEGPTRAIFKMPRHPYTVGLITAAREAIALDSAYYSIPGSPPNLLDLGPGCSFAPRCRHAKAVCTSSPPAQRSFGDATAACVLEDGERPWLMAAEEAKVG